jgi:hypothetical protein
VNNGIYMNGTLDEVRIYSRALAPADVLTLYNTTATSCASPVGYTGDTIYNSAYHVPQFCNGTNWIPVGKVPGAGGGGCSSPAGNEGVVGFTSTSRVMQYCDGAVWRAMGNVPISGLVGWWNFDEGSGTSAADSSGNGNTGTLHGSPLPTWTTGGYYNGALSFDGAQNYVSVPTSASLNLSSFSISAWTETTSTTNWQWIAEKATSGNGNYYFYYESSPNKLVCGFWNGSFYNHSYAWTPSTNTWYHLACTFDSAGQIVNIFINGSPVFSASETHTPSTNGNSLWIGRSSENNAFTWTGPLDDVRIYNRALSASEIWRLYNGAP